jgi:hypothetical protein
MDSANQTTQVIVWDRGRPARNAPQARSLSKVIFQTISRFALTAGGTPAVPTNHLTVTLPCLFSRDYHAARARGPAESRFATD